MAFIHVLVCIYMLNGLFAEVLNNSPVILEKTKDKDDIIIDAGSNFNLTCMGNKPLKWTFPKMYDPGLLDKHKTEFKTIGDRVDVNGFNYTLTLHIKNISYPFVGYYTCQYNNEDEILSDKIYIYVNDSEHLSVEDDFRVYYAVQYEQAIIPCRPTTPDIKVELKEIMDIETQYNPKVGFTFFVDDVRYQDNYFCNFSRLSDRKVITQTIFLGVTTPRSSLAKPYIEDASQNHTEVGDNITLKCYLQEDASNIGFEWTSPKGVVNATESKTISDKKNGKTYLVNKVTIKNTTKADAGIYTCKVSDRQNHTNLNSAHIYIQEKNSCFVHISGIESDQEKIFIEEGQYVQWVLKVTGHPNPEFKWYDTKNKEINKSGGQYIIEDLPDNRTLFKINDTSLENNGIYTLRGRCSKENLNNPHSKIELRLNLTVITLPKVTLNSQKVYLENIPVKINCSATSNPLPEITWKYECINETGSCGEIPIEATAQTTVIAGYTKTSTVKLTPRYKGILKCYADNIQGQSKKATKIYTSDVKDGFDIYNFDVDTTIKRNGKSVTAYIAKSYPLNFTCAVSPHRGQDIEILHNDRPINDAEIEVTMKNDKMSVKNSVYLREASTNDSGVYSCRIKNIDNLKYEFKNVTIIVQEPESPRIIATNLTGDVNIEYPKMPVTLYCNYTGVPKVSVDWYKDDISVTPSDHIVFEEDKSIMKIHSTVVSDEGRYKCLIHNSVGSESREGKLKFLVKPTSTAGYYIIIVACITLLLVLICYILNKIRKEKKLMKELKRLGLENFHKGNPEHINPELGIDDQAELLPYDKKWEFPIEHLKLGKQLGSGAFGVVMKAEAKGIINGEEKTVVAVKMVKKNADHTYIKALASELKIMVHLGKHINVVNLLGACTENVAKKELLVIVEFCRFGNLQNYLYKHRESFINQVDPRTGTIDCNIGSQVLDRLYSVSSDNGSVITTPYSMQDYREKERNAVPTTPTQVTSGATGDDQVTLSNNSIQPEWRTNYHGDYRGDVKPVSTTDLLTWSFQIARGMEYLASRKVLHGDLAARNILLTDKNVVKICDFGLAKSMYNDNNYKKKGNSPLPVKWMAIESIRDRVFSTQSDVWSFGIVLWELFSLARTPYPGMEADERLYYKLVQGYRMESPVHAPTVIYSIMEDCWQSKPLARPSFTTLVERIGSLLENSVRKHYVELNDPYLMMNTHKIEGQDYLAMVSPPSFDLLSMPSPHYVNEGAHPFSPAVKSPEGYTFMGANTIFSPRLQEGGMFDFDIAKKNESSPKEHPELNPMLYHNDSDGESGYLRPNTPINSISNPTYHLPPTLNSLKSPDNYITMPQYKNIVMNNQNPAVQIDLTKDNQKAHYVNNDVAMWDAINV